jgi:hypothetical protein
MLIGEKKTSVAGGISHACFKQGQFIVGLEMLAKEENSGSGFRQDFRGV